MAAALGAIKGFFHQFMVDHHHDGDSPRRVLTILDVLEPRSAQG